MDDVAMDDVAMDDMAKKMWQDDVARGCGMDDYGIGRCGKTMWYGHYVLWTIVAKKMWQR